MGSKTFRGYKRELASLYVTCILISLALGTSNGSVVVIRGDISLSFDDLEANFAPSVKESGVCGVLYLADPLDACSPLTNRVIAQQGEGLNSSFALIIRGGCTFTDKVRRAQNAGFKAAIVYDNEDGGSLVSMAGNSIGIKIHAVFISKAAGEKLKTYAGTVLWIIPMFENSAWSVMAISFILLLAMAAVLATCFFVRRHSIRRQRSRVPLDVHEFHGMSNRSVRALPSLVYTSILEDNCTSRTCAICLEDYAIGEKLRILPCLHKFHTICVDSWLTTWRTFCPMCKHDARARTGNPPASESTPLLSSTAFSPQSPVHSSLSSTTSSAIQIAPLGSSRSCINSLPSTPYVSYSLRSSYRDSPAMSISRSSIDLRNASFHRSHTNLATSQSIGCRFSPLDSRYGSPCILSSTNASPGHGGSSSHHQYLLNYDSAASISPMVSAQSLPGC